MKAKKSLGQNFLIDLSVVQQIIDAANISKDETVVEVGPGTGVLTEELVQKAKHVTAVELDEDLLPFLRMRFKQADNFTLIHHDALNYQPPSEPYKLVANFPYYITSPLINHYLLEQFQNGKPPTQMTIMVQKEVAEKIMAKSKHSVLSLQVHLFGEPELVCIVPREAFEPRPKVDSAVLNIKIHKEPKIKGDLKKIFWMFHISFAQKRKKLSNNLAAALKRDPKETREFLESLKIHPDARAEALTMDEWAKLLSALSSDQHS